MDTYTDWKMATLGCLAIAFIVVAVAVTLLAVPGVLGFGTLAP